MLDQPIRVRQKIYYSLHWFAVVYSYHRFDSNLTNLQEFFFENHKLILVALNAQCSLKALYPTQWDQFRHWLLGCFIFHHLKGKGKTVWHILLQYILRHLPQK